MFFYFTCIHTWTSCDTTELQTCGDQVASILQHVWSPSQGGEGKKRSLHSSFFTVCTCQTKSDFRLLILRVWIPCQRLLCAVCMPCTKHKACLSSLLGTLHILFVIYIKLYLKRNLIQFYVNKTRIFSLNKNASVVLYIEKKLY